MVVKEKKDILTGTEHKNNNIDRHENCLVFFDFIPSFPPWTDRSRVLHAHPKVSSVHEDRSRQRPVSWQVRCLSILSTASILGGTLESDKGRTVLGGGEKRVQQRSPNEMTEGRCAQRGRSRKTTRERERTDPARDCEPVDEAAFMKRVSAGQQQEDLWFPFGRVGRRLVGREFVLGQTDRARVLRLWQFERKRLWRKRGKRGHIE